VALAVIRLKRQLEHDYEEAYPGLRDIIPTIVDQEEKNAWQLSSFPHRLLPALLEVRWRLLTTKFKSEPTSTNKVEPERDAELASLQSPTGITRARASSPRLLI